MYKIPFAKQASVELTGGSWALTTIIFADEDQYCLLQREVGYLGRYVVIRRGRLSLITTDKQEAIRKLAEDFPPEPKKKEAPNWVLWVLVIVFLLTMLYMVLG